MVGAVSFVGLFASKAPIKLNGIRCLESDSMTLSLDNGCPVRRSPCSSSSPLLYLPDRLAACLSADLRLILARYSQQMLFSTSRPPAGPRSPAASPVVSLFLNAGSGCPLGARPPAPKPK